MINISHSKVADLNEAIAKPDALWFDGVTVPKAEGAVVEATVILDIPNIAIFIEDHRGPATNMRDGEVVIVDLAHAPVLTELNVAIAENNLPHLPGGHVPGFTVPAVVSLGRVSVTVVMPIGGEAHGRHQISVGDRKLSRVNRCQPPIPQLYEAIACGDARARAEHALDVATVPLRMTMD